MSLSKFFFGDKILGHFRRCHLGFPFSHFFFLISNPFSHLFILVCEF